MKKYKYIACFSLAALMGATSCQDLLTEKPNSYYEENNFFVSVANARMSVLGIYDTFARMENFGQVEMAMPASDDTYYIQGVNTDNTRRDIAHYTLSTANQWVNNIWIAKYQGLERANYTITNIEKMDLFKAGDSELLEVYAEAKFLRAFISFDLVKYWGDVPYKTFPTTSVSEAYQPRMSREAIYDQIVEDLNYAKNVMPWAEASSSPERATQGSVRGLLMRVLLQRSGYSLQMNGQKTRPEDAKREEYFKAIIAEWEAFQAAGAHGFFDQGYKEFFAANSYGTLNSKESLFEIAFFNAEADKEDSGNWATYNGPLVAAPNVGPTEMGNYMGRANAFFRVVPSWKNYFEEDDTRRDVMVCTYQFKWDNALKQHVKTENKESKNWYPGKWRREWMPLGYKDQNNTNVNYCVLRYADVVLMAAEAYNELNNPAAAWTLINEVRTRANATPISGANYADFYKAPKVLNLDFIADGDEQGKVRTALYWERGFELAFEGVRKYDLIRWDILKESMVLLRANNKSITKAYPAGENFKEGQHELFPIPLNEILINHKLESKNNPGY